MPPSLYPAYVSIDNLQLLLHDNSLPPSTPGWGGLLPALSVTGCVTLSKSPSPGLYLPLCKIASSLTLPNLSPLLLSGRLSFLVNSLANTVMDLLVPALPKLVKIQVSGIRASLVFKDGSPCGAGVELQVDAQGPVSP